MIRWFFRWLFRLVFVIFTLAVIAVVALLLSYNSILRGVIEHRIRAQTGLDAEIGKFKLAIFSPSIELQNIKIYNPKNFGGAPFLNIPEIHIEYDRAALLEKKLHITLLRLNLAELDIVKNRKGQTNIFAFAGLPGEKSVTATGLNPGKSPVTNYQPKNAAPKNSNPARPKNRTVPARAKNRAPELRQSLEKQTGFDFAKKIDVLNVSIGKLKFIDLQNPGHDRTQIIGLENIVIPNVKSEKDLESLAMLIYLRSGGFFESLAGPQNLHQKSATVQDVLNLIGAF